MNGWDCSKSVQRSERAQPVLIPCLAHQDLLYSDYVRGHVCHTFSVQSLRDRRAQYLAKVLSRFPDIPAKSAQVPDCNGVVCPSQLGASTHSLPQIADV